MRVLMTHWLYPPEYSGAGLQGHRLARELQKLGVNVFVLAGTDARALVGVNEIDGIAVSRMLRETHSIPAHVRYWRALNHYISSNKGQIDLVHTHGFHPRINIAARFARLPIITKITNQTVDDPVAVLNRKGGYIKSKLYNLADAVISTSRALENLCKRANLPHKKIVRLPNGVDVQEFRPLTVRERIRQRQILGAPEYKIVLLTVGPVSYSKGLDSLIRAVAFLDESTKKKICIWVVGPTTNENGISTSRSGKNDFFCKIESKIKHLGLSDLVQFKGQQQNMHDFFGAADIYVHPSRKEGQPNALLEAMASGLPVVANVLPGITDEMTQSGRVGHLVNAENPQHFAAAIRLLVNNPALRARFGRKAREHVIKNYSIKSVAKSYVELYSNVLRMKMVKIPKNK